MFEVPMICINTMRNEEYLTDKMLESMPQMDECDIKIEDHFSVDRRISDTFR